MENPTERKTDENPYTLLKQKLLSGSVSFMDIRKKLLELDQSTLSRDASEQNLEFLRDPQIVEYINNQSDEVSRGFRGILSFTEFHVGQRLAVAKPDQAIENFKRALENAVVNREVSWAAYIEGTLLYMQGKEIPEDLIAKVDQPKNVRILRNLNIGLKQRHVPFYNEDYNK